MLPYFLLCVVSFCFFPVFLDDENNNRLCANEERIMCSLAKSLRQSVTLKKTKPQEKLEGLFDFVLSHRREVRDGPKIKV